MNEINALKEEIRELKSRNARVEADKAWETSWMRKLLISALTYIAITLFFYFASLSKPFISAIVPTIGFVISTLSVPIFKNIWIKKCTKQN